MTLRAAAVDSPLPSVLRPSRLLAALSAVGAGCLLAAGSGAGHALLFSRADYAEPLALASAVPTLFLGILWVILLRWKTQRGATSEDLLGPTLLLASVDAALAQCTFEPLTHPMNAIAFLLTGAFASPLALVVAIPLVGAPFVWAQRQARRGLSAEERGQRLLGALLMVLSSLALALSAWRLPTSNANRFPGLANDIFHEGLDFLVSAKHRDAMAWRWPDSPVSYTLAGLACAGVLLGLLTAALAALREHWRSRLLAAVERGARTDLRIERTEQGKVLLRVPPPADEPTYRQGAHEQPLFALDEHGRVARPLGM